MEGSWRRAFAKVSRDRGTRRAPGGTVARRLITQRRPRLPRLLRGLADDVAALRWKTGIRKRSTSRRALVGRPGWTVSTYTDEIIAFDRWVAERFIGQRLVSRVRGPLWK